MPLATEDHLFAAAFEVHWDIHFRLPEHPDLHAVEALGEVGVTVDLRELTWQDVSLALERT